MQRQILTGILALVACTLRPYTSDSVGATGTSTATTSSSTGATMTTSSPSLPTTAATTTHETATTDGPMINTWRGLYHRTDVDGVTVEHAFLDCASRQLLQLRTDLLPYSCCTVKFDDGLWLEFKAILHPDGDDPDALDELEIIELLADPCKLGSCELPYEWSACDSWPAVCGYCRACDQWVQDCPEGQKCMPWSGDGDNSWESLTCAPVAPNAGGLGDPCTAEDGGLSGIDTCAKGHMCWNLDPDTGVGTCVAQCAGSPDDPQCPDCTLDCTIASEGALTLCLFECSPLQQDCVGNDLCIPNNPEQFICVLDASGDEGQLFGPCEEANTCDPGLWCAPSDHASECDPMAAGCCLPFCDANQPVCPGVGLECVEWPGQDLPCGEVVGMCRLP